MEKVRAVCDGCGKKFASADTAVSHYRSQHGGGASIHYHGKYGITDSNCPSSSCNRGKTTIHSKGIKFPL